jgi:hypothetical protein
VFFCVGLVAGARGSHAKAEPTEALPQRAARSGWFAGPEVGGTLNPDQWLAGGHVGVGDLAGSLWAELALAGAFGGNHGGARAAVRTGYTFWPSDGVPFGFGPVLGASGQYFFPVGSYARFCDRVDLDACRGFELGVEAGGSLRYDWVRATVLAGFIDMPAVTIVVGADLLLSTGAR